MRRCILVLACGLMCSCGGSTGADDTGQSDSGTSGECPKYQPYSFGSCTDESLICSYPIPGGGCSYGTHEVCECENGSWHCTSTHCPPPDPGPQVEDILEVVDSGELPTEAVLEVIDAVEAEELPAEDTPVAPDTPGGDTTLETPPCNGVPNNAPCDTKGAECADTSPWCGSMMTYHMCHCNGTEWQCISAGAPVDCHECCQEAIHCLFYGSFVVAWASGWSPWV